MFSDNGYYLIFTGLINHFWLHQMMQGLLTPENIRFSDTLLYIIRCNTTKNIIYQSRIASISVCAVYYHLPYKLSKFACKNTQFLRVFREKANKNANKWMILLSISDLFVTSYIYVLILLFKRYAVIQNLSACSYVNLLFIIFILFCANC